MEKKPLTEKAFPVLATLICFLQAIFCLIVIFTIDNSQGVNIFVACCALAWLAIGSWVIYLEMKKQRIEKMIKPINDLSKNTKRYK
jgi:hydrogenase-4 membrane subunit HyfE